jgi:hypothetical protein
MINALVSGSGRSGCIVGHSENGYRAATHPRSPLLGSLIDYSRYTPFRLLTTLPVAH